VRIRLLAIALVAAGNVNADQAVYLMRGPVLPADYAANGYVVDVRHRGDGAVEVRVETSLNPIGAEGSLAAVASGNRPSVPESFELPASLRSKLTPDLGAWEAATTVLEWVDKNLSLIDDDPRPQDAVSVLRRKGGRCSGLSNATAALLMAAGFEARTVSGLLVTGRRAIPHRWVECRLPGAGWVPTDPTLGWWTITPRHIAFGDAVLRTPEIETLEPATGELHRLPRSGTTIVRPNAGAELVCRLSDATDDRAAVASLIRGSDRRRAVLEPEARFESLLPGRWLLIVEVEGRVVERREMTLRSGVVHSYTVRLPFEELEEVGS
jgi:hypothetical protein